MPEKIYDESITEAVKKIIAKYEAISGLKIPYGVIGKDGMGFISESGALVLKEEYDIAGGFVKSCSFPFFLLCRKETKDEKARLSAGRILENFGKWITGEPVYLNGSIHELTSYDYPVLGEGKVIYKITRENYYPEEPNGQAGTQDWILPVTVFYEHEKEA